MGAIVHEGGVAFRVWAPNATGVAVTGDWNDWSEEGDPMAPEQGGCWYADLPRAADGHEYSYRIDGPDGSVSRIDPYARVVTNSVGNGIVTDGAYDWGDDAFEMPSRNALVIYELHVGTFNRPGRTATRRAVSPTRSAGSSICGGWASTRSRSCRRWSSRGDVSWGYNPAHIFAVEGDYGGPTGLKDFVKAAHAAGLAVILDVVYNHFGPSDLDLWRFDGWGEDEAGRHLLLQRPSRGHRRGATRDRTTAVREVRQFIRDNALYWLEEFRVDGLRWDMTLTSARSRGSRATRVTGFRTAGALMAVDQRRDRGALSGADQHRRRSARTSPGIIASTGDGGAGFDAAVGCRLRPSGPRGDDRRRGRGPEHGGGASTR